MPTTLWGITLYIAALFPGVAYAFAREGHRAVAKRTVLRETVTFVFVSFVCDAIVIVVILFAAIWFRPLGTVILQLVQGDFSWVSDNLLLAALFACGIIALTTLLGFALGSKWIYEGGLKKLWDAPTPRDESAWTKVFKHEDGEVVDVSLVLKSGAWVGGVLNSFDDDPDPHVNREITIINPMYREAGGEKEAPTETHFAVISASEIELLQATLRKAPADDVAMLDQNEGSTDQD
ncbi:DUF6338 family protein [Leucobacter chromiiresistens]|uniref:Uncharacterized protein n=1 Tax=Leucobacter chromiiresistens TaxID=1079994 RepID=A0A1H0YG07_9MICO|nr:DUF6338 family protein [Leucobacter chromiiresistens]SDQ14175.1 hypothetical protein SAMN04488565_0845 [Leucobacter chromiiresistens]